MFNDWGKLVMDFGENENRRKRRKIWFGGENANLKQEKNEDGRRTMWKREREKNNELNIWSSLSKKIIKILFFEGIFFGYMRKEKEKKKYVLIKDTRIVKLRIDMIIVDVPSQETLNN